ncbi:hypothetical protein EYC84_003742 [Monilinia fructicola]|uniref:Uncharacterized protein n=1 Tax=Monilinia fructicola TaxID=38448 RepID=A0A5M9JUQ6_MONFR|nr:hypothetical protein EYC84_003742 [Monilinia fructicola]
MPPSQFHSGQMTHHRNRPRHSIHRLSELVPRLEALRAASAVCQAKTEYRQGDYLEELTKRRYMGEVAEDKVEHIRNSFATLNERISQLHQPVPSTRKISGKEPAIVDGGNAEAEKDKEIVEVDDEKDENYNGDGGVRYRRLTAEEEKEDEQHWRQTVNALPKDTRMTEYYVEMGYQMGPALSSQRETEKQDSPAPHKPSRPTSLLKIRIGTPSRDTPQFDRSLHGTSTKRPSVSSPDQINQMQEFEASEASSSTLAPPPAKRHKPEPTYRMIKCIPIVYLDDEDDLTLDRNIFKRFPYPPVQGLPYSINGTIYPYCDSSCYS